jgi:acyl-CoA thioesterase I
MLHVPSTRPQFSSRQVGWFAIAVNAAVLIAAIFVDGTSMSATSNAPIKVVAYGDSLTAGFMLQPNESFPAQLAARAKTRGLNVDVLNAGVSGDTTAAGLERFEWAVPEAVILELGANDSLRGIEPAVARKNLDEIITRLKARNIEVLLTGMLAPKNWGEAYSKAFDGIFADLAAKHDLVLYPFFLDGVALDASLNLPDGLHPNAKGIAVIVDRIMPKFEELLTRVTARAATSSKS